MSIGCFNLDIRMAQTKIAEHLVRALSTYLMSSAFLECSIT